MPPSPAPELLPLLDAEPLLDPLLEAEPLLEPLSSPPPSVAPELLPELLPVPPPDDDELQPPTAVNAPSVSVSPAMARTCNFIGLSFSINPVWRRRYGRHTAARPVFCDILAHLSSF